jgi:hypothetical protein
LVINGGCFCFGLAMRLVTSDDASSWFRVSVCPQKELSSPGDIGVPDRHLLPPAALRLAIVDATSDGVPSATRHAELPYDVWLQLNHRYRRARGSQLRPLALDEQLAVIAKTTDRSLDLRTTDRVRLALS